MADRRRDQLVLPSRSSLTTNGIAPNGALTSAAQLLQSSVQEPTRYLQNYQWQSEAWDFYESLGEFNYGVEWFGEALSRVRLLAAKVSKSGDEPEILDSGPAAELAAGLCNGTDGQSQLLRSLAVQLSVPGEAYFVGRDVTEIDEFTGVLLDAEPDEYGRVWTVQPKETMRQARRTFRDLLGRERRGWDMRVDDTRWVRLPAESLVTRIWDRHERLPWLAMSPARAALPIMREVDMYNRQVMATLVSRVAMNGMLLIPDEVVLPVNPQYEEEVDPFFAELIDIMRAAIKNPGAPSSAAPIPLRIPAELIDKIKHLIFATPLDNKLFEAREQTLRRLATTLNLPAEIITGMGDVNHWSSWQLTEDAIKMHISPKVEIVTRCLTMGYLHPMLRALGEQTRTKDGERIIFWYDTSELTQRPDRSEAARALRDMMIITDAATRRENGFDEADAPTDDELEKMVLMKLAVQPQTAMPALKELTGLEMEMPVPPAVPGQPTPPGVSGPVGADEEGSGTDREPTTRDEQPPDPDEGVTSSAFYPAGRYPAGVRRDAVVLQTHSARRRARMALDDPQRR